MECLDENEVLALVNGSLAGTALQNAHEHLDSCSQCVRLIGLLQQEVGDPEEDFSTDSGALTTESHGEVRAPAALGMRQVFRTLTIAELIAAVDRGMKRRRKSLVTVGALLVIGLVLLGAYVWNDRGDGAYLGPCTESLYAVDNVWSPTRRRLVKHAVAETKASYAASTFQTIDTMATAYTDALRRQLKAACADSFVHKETSQDEYDLQSRCIGQARDELDRSLRLLQGSGETILRNSVGLLQRAGNLAGRCEDKDWLTSTCARRELFALDQIGDTGGQLFAIRQLMVKEEFEQALVRAEEFLQWSAIVDPGGKTLAELHGRMLLARVLSALGRPREAAQHLEAAVYQASALGCETLAASATVHLYSMYAILEEEQALARWMPIARATVALQSPALQGAWQYAQGEAAFYKRRFQVAQGHYEKTLALWGQAWGATDVRLAEVLQAAGDSHLLSDELDLAQRSYAASEIMQREALGEGHPGVMVSGLRLRLARSLRARDPGAGVSEAMTLFAHSKAEANAERAARLGWFVYFYLERAERVGATTVRRWLDERTERR